MKRSGVPKVSVDYFFMSTADQVASTNPVLVMVDESTGEKYARAVGQKGVGNPGDLEWLKGPPWRRGRAHHPEV